MHIELRHSRPALTRARSSPRLKSKSAAWSRDLPVVGIRVPGWATYTRSLYYGILDYMRAHSQWQIRTMMDSTNELKPVVIDENWRGDGLMAFRYKPTEAEAFRRNEIPVVNLSSESIGMGAPTVIPDNAEAGRLAAEYLAGLGFRSFYYLGDPSRHYSRERQRGFEEWLKVRGLECGVINIEPDSFPWSRRWERLGATLRGELKRLRPPLAVFTKDDIFAANVIHTVTDLGFSVPRDVAVLGMNSDEIFCHTTAPPLSSVLYPGRQIGFLAAEMLDRMMSEPGYKPPEVSYAAVTRVEERESTNTLAFSEEAVVDAVTLIRERAPRYPLRVKELLESVPMSKSTFIKRFTSAVGHGPKDEITRVRVEEARRLLENTEWTVGRIASEMQFETSEELGRFFKRETGEKPSAYRKRATLWPPERARR